MDEFLVDGTLGYIDDNSRLEVGYDVEETTAHLQDHMANFAIPCLSALAFSLTSQSSSSSILSPLSATATTTA